MSAAAGRPPCGRASTCPNRILPTRPSVSPARDLQRHVHHRVDIGLRPRRTAGVRARFRNVEQARAHRGESRAPSWPPRAPVRRQAARGPLTTRGGTRAGNAAPPSDSAAQRRSRPAVRRCAAWRPGICASCSTSSRSEEWTHQALRIGMPRRAITSSTGPVSTMRPAYDGDAVGGFRDHAHVVRDEQHGCAMRLASAWSMAMICACTDTSSAVVGSSAMTSDGSQASASAMTTRCRMPPENSCGQASLARRRQADFLEQCDRAGIAPFSPSGRCGSSRSAGRRCAGADRDWSAGPGRSLPMRRPRSRASARRRGRRSAGLRNEFRPRRCARPVEQSDDGAPCERLAGLDSPTRPRISPGPS